MKKTKKIDLASEIRKAAPGYSIDEDWAFEEGVMWLVKRLNELPLDVILESLAELGEQIKKEDK